MAQIRAEKKSGGFTVREWMGYDEETGDNIYQPHYLRKGTTRAQAEKFKNDCNRREKERKLGILPTAQAKEKKKSISGITFKDYCELKYLPDFIAAYPRSEVKKRNHLKHLYEVFGDMPLAAGKKALLDRWGQYRDMRIKDDGISMVTLECEWQTFTRVLNKAAERDVIKGNPLAGMTFRKNKEDIGGDVVEKEIQIFSVDDLNAIYEAGGEFWGAQYRFIANTGLRRAEVIQQQRRDVMREMITVAHDPSRGLLVKNNKTRRVPLSPGAQESADIIRFHHKDGERFFDSHKHQTFYGDTGDSVFSKVFRAHCNKADVLHGTLHGLRHTFISHLANDRGVPLDVVRQLAGHKSINTTMRYVHGTDDQLQNAVVDLNI